jgi:peptidoglycan/LPS O-acetylase OafA/YrhL
VHVVPAPAGSSSADRYVESVLPQHVPQLDAIRGIACLFVLVGHLQAVSGLTWLPAKMGTVGVGVFFALSGFLITRILIAAREHRRGLNAFYNRRAARIFPVYFLTLAVLALTWPGQELRWAADFTFNLQYLTGVREYFHIDAGAGIVPPVAHVWSLCVEEHFYWFWPALVCLVPARYGRWLPALCIAATPAVTSLVVDQLAARGLQPAPIEGLVSRLTPTQLVAISLGALAAFHERRLLQPAKIFGGTIRPLSVAGVVLLVVSIAGWQYSRIVPDADRLRLVCRPTLLHLACGGLFALGIAAPSLGRSAWLNGVGRMSYGLYLYHLPIYALFGLAQSRYAVSPWLGLLALLATFAVAAVSYRFFETPILGWMGRRQTGLTLRRGRCALSLGSALTLVLACVFGVDAALWFHEHPVMPREWRYVNYVSNGVTRPSGNFPDSVRSQIDGATHAYRWMGAVHAVDADWFRRTKPVPPKTPGIPRVATVGDSYVWGACVDADRVLAPVTQQILANRGVSMEVLNLAKPGGQVEDILKLIRESILPLQPEIVVYGATVDDFTPSGEVSGRYKQEQYRTDPAFADRFRRSIRAMQEACREQGVAFRLIPFTQSLDEPETVATVRFMQALCRLEGVPMIDIDDYLRDCAGQHFRTSRWDGHPNEQCHRLYAEMVAAELMQMRAGVAVRGGVKSAASTEY